MTETMMVETETTITEPHPMAARRTAIEAFRAAVRRRDEADERALENERRVQQLTEEIELREQRLKLIRSETAGLAGMRRRMSQEAGRCYRNVVDLAPPEMRAMGRALALYETELRRVGDLRWDEMSHRLHVLRCAERWLKEAILDDEGEYGEERITMQAERLDRELPGFSTMFWKLMEVTHG